MSNRRAGKIARLPKQLRDVVNLMLQDGATSAQIIGKLGEHGSDINDQNITNWKAGGFQDWLKEQERLADMKSKREFAFEIVRENEGSKLHEAGLQLAASQLYEVLSDFDVTQLKTLLKESPENYAAIVNSLAKLSSGALDIEKFKQNVAEQKRKIEAELGKVKTDGGLTAETIGKIEEALKLL